LTGQAPMSIFAILRTRFMRWVWQTDLQSLPGWHAALIQAARLIYAVGRDFTQGQLSLHAMSLVYTTLLSLVPLLAVSFSVLKGFGVHNQVEPILLQALAPLGDKSDEIASQLISYVDNTNVGVLGSVGLAFLLYSVVALISKIEQVFNYTWHVEDQRGVAKRISQYLGILLIGPLLLFSALGATSAAQGTAVVQQLIAIEPFGLLLDSGARLVPYLLVVLAFTFAYSFVPNTRVKLGAAVLGALIAGLLWQSVGYMFATFMANSTRYAAIYSGLAILILFMIWVYIAWLILLIGASIAFYIQFPEFLGTRSRDLRLSNRLRERVALCIAAEIAARHQRGDPPCDAEALAGCLHLPVTNVRNLLAMLADGGFIVATADEPPRYVPARAPTQVSVSQVLFSIRRYDEDEQAPARPRCSPSVVELQATLDHAIEHSLADMTLAELAERLTPTEAGTGAGLESTPEPEPEPATGPASAEPGQASG
jgi:membrane protein